MPNERSVAALDIEARKQFDQVYEAAAAEAQMHKMTGARKSAWALISGRFELHK